MTRLVGQNVTCVRGSREVFAGLDFEVAAGGALAVTGPNGAGKSSLLRILAGLLPAESGTIRFDGGNAELPLKEQAHYLGHRDPLKAALSVRENLAFWQAYLGGEVADMTTALAAVGLDAIGDLPAAFLSAGQRRRLSMARLLAVKRPVWLLDEPTTALDSAGQISFAAIMQSHLASGGHIVAATHAPIGIPTNEIRLGGAA
ncbi:MAG: heme ABC exporter ATP-binding protein CcmA [Xanthobacteraceae bacterium]|nr:heme ABC exporter ATP-binding protein CcmA [Xanthobacteraceae bacterium]